MKTRNQPQAGCMLDRLVCGPIFAQTDRVVVTGLQRIKAKAKVVAKPWKGNTATETPATPTSSAPAAPPTKPAEPTPPSQP